jgi:O-antigen ligase
MVALAALLAVSLGVPQARHRILGKAGFSHATGGRSKLVSNGVKVALHHPVIGVGTGGFRGAYAKLTHLKEGKDPKAAASHDTPITVASETGLPGLALLGWIVWVAFTVPFRRNRARAPTEKARLAFGLALVAIVVHSLFYDALFEDPLFWGAMALSVVAARAEEAV